MKPGKLSKAVSLTIVMSYCIASVPFSASGERHYGVMKNGNYWFDDFKIGQLGLSAYYSKKCRYGCRCRCCLGLCYTTLERARKMR